MSLKYCFVVQLSAVIKSIPSSAEGEGAEDLYRWSPIGMLWYQLIKLSDVLASHSGADQISLNYVTVGLCDYFYCNKRAEDNCC